MPRRHLRWGLALLVVSLPGCYDGYDPLDPERLAEIARTRGTAQGFALTGVYRGSFEAVECGCNQVTLDGLLDLSLCATVELAEQIGIPGLFDLLVVQADGTMQLRPVAAQDQLTGESLLPTLYGPLDIGGELTAAGILQIDGFVFRGQVLGRADGTLTGPPGASVLHVDYQQRYTLDILGGSLNVDDFGEEPTVQSVDCRERIDMDLVWTQPLPDPDMEPEG